MREWVAHQIALERFHPQLLGNFDQTWSLNFQPRKRTLQPCHRCDVKSIHMRRLKHNLERCLGLPLSEALGDVEQKPHEFRPAGLQGGFAANSAVDFYRVPHTLCTLTWSDGAVGRGYATCRSDYLTENQRRDLNQELRESMLQSCHGAVQNENRRHSKCNFHCAFSLSYDAVFRNRWFLVPKFVPSRNFSRGCT